MPDEKIEVKQHKRNRPKRRKDDMVPGVVTPTQIKKGVTIVGGSPAKRDFGRPTEGVKIVQQGH